IPLYMSHGVASKKFIELAGDAAEGLVLPAGRLLASAQVPDGHPQKALLTKYVADYTKKFGSAPSTFGGHTYDALMLVVSAVKAGKSAKPQDIRDNLEKTKNLAGAGGVYSMSPENHNGLDESAFFMVTIEKGEWKVVD
ncbi:MAG: ABC transporter substrate-binding protein, partial [Humidesulfovibrio sp.]|nr:ABC transporter substrate-binding protein [Humidesulfovibrio sp.]